uniref:FHA domain-containing protein n=1 Tax=Heterosigma akashiwo TaxID=2829 RepID=A0A6V1P0Z9_HETAK
MESKESSSLEHNDHDSQQYRDSQKTIREKELLLESASGALNSFRNFISSDVNDEPAPDEIASLTQRTPTEGKDSTPSPKDFFLDAKTNDFKPPDWVKRTTYNAVLDVYKGIELVSTIQIHGKGWYLLGRNPTVCDVILDHASISRKHAAILYHVSGCAYIVDLGAAHGTFLGSKRLRPFKPRLLKSGRLIRFGASTRYYVFNAYMTPNQLERTELKTNPLIYEGGFEGGEEEKRQLCMNTLLNRRVKDCLPPAPANESMLRRSDEERAERKKKQKLRFLKKKEYIEGFWDQFGGQDGQSGMFSSLVQSKIIKKAGPTTGNSVLPVVGKRPAPQGAAAGVTAAERRRRQMALMGQKVAGLQPIKKQKVGGAPVGGVDDEDEEIIVVKK